MRIWCFLWLACAGYASTIPVSGSGSFDNAFDNMGWDISFSFAGTSGTESVALKAMTGFDMGSVDPLHDTFADPGLHAWVGQAILDDNGNSVGTDLDNPSLPVAFLFGNGGGFVTVDGITANVRGYINITSEGPSAGGIHGTFSITPTPEPATATAVLVSALCWLRWRQRKPRLRSYAPPAIRSRQRSQSAGSRP